jgi:hypothetical protein
MDSCDVFPNQLLDALVQISMACGVSHPAASHEPQLTREHP